MREGHSYLAPEIYRQHHTCQKAHAHGCEWGWVGAQSTSIMGQMGGRWVLTGGCWVQIHVRCVRIRNPEAPTEVARWLLGSHHNVRFQHWVVWWGPAFYIYTPISCPFASIWASLRSSLPPSTEQPQLDALLGSDPNMILIAKLHQSLFTPRNFTRVFLSHETSPLPFHYISSLPATSPTSQATSSESNTSLFLLFSLILLLLCNVV